MKVTHKKAKEHVQFGTLRHTETFYYKGYTYVKYRIKEDGYAFCFDLCMVHQFEDHAMVLPVDVEVVVMEKS